MSAKQLKILAVFAALGILAATWAVRHELSSWAKLEQGDKFFPALAERLDTVRRVQVSQGGRTLTFKLLQDGWVLAESDDYPLNPNFVQDVLRNLSELARLERKTGKPQLLARLHLQNPQAKGAQSRRLILSDANNAVLADLIVGKENLLLQAIGEGGVYVRLPDSDQAWLASGELKVGGEPKDWLKNPILTVPRGRIERAIVSQPNGDRLVVVRSRGAEGGFALKGLGDNEELVSAYYPGDIARALEDLELMDARRRDRIEFPADKTTHAEFLTLDGLVVRLELTEIGSATWLRVASIGFVKRDAAANPKALAEEARRLTEATKNWAYSVPEFESVHLKKRRDAVVKRRGSES